MPAILSWLRRHWLLSGLTALLCYYAVAGDYERQWERQGQVYLGAPAEAIWPWLAELPRWPEWLIWTDYPFPQLEPGEQDGIPVSWVVSASGERIAQLGIVDRQPPLSLLHNLASSDEALTGSCRFSLTPGRHETRLNWQCQGIHDDRGWRAVALRFGRTPPWPYDLRASMRRLQQRFPP